MLNEVNINECFYPSKITIPSLIQGFEEGESLLSLGGTDYVCYWIVFHQLGLWNHNNHSTRKLLYEIMIAILKEIHGDKLNISSYASISNKYNCFIKENSIAETKFLDEPNPAFWEDQYLTSFCTKKFPLYRSICEVLLEIFKKKVNANCTSSESLNEVIGISPIFKLGIHDVNQILPDQLKIREEKAEDGLCITENGSILALYSTKLDTNNRFKVSVVIKSLQAKGCNYLCISLSRLGVLLFPISDIANKFEELKQHEYLRTGKTTSWLKGRYKNKSFYLIDDLNTDNYIDVTDFFKPI